MQRQYKGSCFLNTDNEEIIKLDYYLILESKNFFEEKIPQMTYGIEIIKNDGESEMVRDVSINEKRINKIIDILIRNTVSPTHLHDIIEDLI